MFSQVGLVGLASEEDWGRKRGEFRGKGCCWDWEKCCSGGISWSGKAMGYVCCSNIE